MTRKPSVRSSLEICEDIAMVLEKANPHYYWPTAHEKNVKDANDFLCGRRILLPKRYLSEVRREAIEAGLGDEIKPLITEARRFLALQEPSQEKRPRFFDPGR